MSITSETDEMTMLKNDADSSSLDDITSEGNMGENCHLKKGPWTSVEDAILVEYVTKNGEGNWNAVQKHSGLARCGKSCRLRWANHLRPDLKKGAFTPQEERHIIELHAKMGNKWARMAAELPGRTDNEIKNYWNTRIKRRQRAGLPIYPSDLCSQPSKDNQPTGDMNDFPINNVEIPNFEIKNLELNQQLYPPPMSSFLDIPTTTLLSQSLHPPYTNRCFTSRAHPSKRFRGLESSFTGLNTHNGHISEPFMLSFEYDNNSNSNHVSSSSVLFSGSHADLNGNLSSSEPGWAMKLELPSFQNQTGHWGWSPSSPLPSLESVDTFQTPPTENVRSCNLSSRNSGLLDAVLYESKTLRNPNNSSGQKISSRDPHETEWDADGDSLSPLGHSTSAFNEGTPISKNSVAKSQSVKHATGWKDQEESRLVPVHHHSDSEASNHMIFYRPDLVLGSDYFAPITIPFSKMQ